MNLFVYGTLKSREQIESLLKRRLGRPAEAVAPGAVVYTSDLGYLAMVPADKGQQVAGLVWRDLTEQDLAVLDKYEGCDAQPPLYWREARKVIINGREETAWMYIGHPEYLKTAFGRG